MGTGLTPNYNLPYAQSTDTVDVSGDLEDLARAIDADIAGIVGSVVSGTSMFLGTTSVAFNRASGPLTLAGLILTTPTIDSIAASAAGATTTIHSAVTTGSIAVGAGLTTGTLNLASAGTGATAINIGHTNSTTVMNGKVGINVAVPSQALDLLGNALVTGNIQVATGVIAIPGASASTPALTTSGDTNTGLFFPATDTVAASTGGTERVRIDSSGNVGIGGSPAGTARLSLSGALRFIANITAADIYTGMGAVASDTVAIATAGTERLRIDSSGNVGIGVTSEGAKLHVKSAWTSNEGQIAADVTAGGTYSGMTMQNDGTIKGLAIWDNSASQLLLSVPGTTGKVALGYNSTTAALTMDASTGNVGIGVTAPAGNLNISSDTAMVQRNEQNSTDAVGGLLQFFKRRGTKASPTIVASGDSVGSLDFRAYDGASAQQMALIAANVDGTPGSGDMPGRLSFWTTPDGSTTLTERMRIDSAGLLSALYGLSITGTIVGSSTISATGLAGSLLSSATPLVEFGTGTAGTSTIPSREDHVHPADGGGGGGTAVGFEASFFLGGM